MFRLTEITIKISVNTIEQLASRQSSTKHLPTKLQHYIEVQQKLQDALHSDPTQVPNSPNYFLSYTLLDFSFRFLNPKTCSHHLFVPFSKLVSLKQKSNFKLTSFKEASLLALDFFFFFLMCIGFRFKHTSLRNAQVDQFPPVPWCCMPCILLLPPVMKPEV